ncbi:MAG: FAD-dependent oxidoreductase, partial [Acidobacteriota bacterium]
RESLGYDKLLMATGYRPLSPSIEGIEADGVFTASRIEDGQAIADWLGSGRARRAVLIGGGYVSLEMAEALRRRRVEVTLIEKTPAVFPALDADMAALVEGELRANGVRVLTGRPAQRILTRQEGSVEGVELESGSPFIPADMVFVDVGVAPRVELAAAAGIHLGSSGAIAVSERMETNVNSVYAAGNCAETFHLVSGRPVFDPVGTVAAKQGRVAGENMAAGRARFPGAVGTTVVKVFGLTAARTGLSAKEARREGFQVREATISGRFQAPYFEGGASGTVKVVADAVSRRLLGAQIVGDAMAGVRIDVVATALTGGMTVDTAAQLDLAYAPPVGALWNPVLIAMNALLRRLDEG